tara:strand:- start:202 stop:702 length:501 start_codon:yes stop_codon:yes gene_type:complete
MTTKGKKSNLEIVKELVGLVKTNNLAQIELEQTTKDTETLKIKISQLIEQHDQTASNRPVVYKKLNKELEENNHDDNRLNNENKNLQSNSNTINSPMVGTVYLAPEPGAEPFVKAGETVKVGQTILIVEAMKTLNQIPATKSGIIKEVLVEDGSPVEFGSPLAIIE